MPSGRGTAARAFAIAAMRTRMSGGNGAVLRTSSTPTGFTLLAGSSNQYITVGTSLSPIAAFQFALNAPSSAEASVTSSRCRLASDDCQRQRDVCSTLMTDIGSSPGYVR